jgi:hypothetical protein
LQHGLHLPPPIPAFHFGASNFFVNSSRLLFSGKSDVSRMSSKRSSA